METAAKPAAIICDWDGCSVVARFHMETAGHPYAGLTGEGGIRPIISDTHHNLCGSHLDEYSGTRMVKSIDLLGKCPICDRA